MTSFNANAGPDRPGWGRTRILRTDVDQVGYEALLGWMSGQCAGDPAGRPCGAVVFANVHVITEAALDSSYAGALKSASVVAPDGMPLVWTSRWLGGTVRDRCYGPVLMERALAFSGQRWSHFFYGATADVLSKLNVAVSRRWPDAKVLGSMAAPFGPFDDAVEARNISLINASGADLLWIGLGCPRQEFWMQRYRASLRVKVVLAVGAAFDFIGGNKPQAPAWMQRSGLEWLHRMSCEPTRLWRRYVTRNPYFISQVVMQKMGLRWRNSDER